MPECPKCRKEINYLHGYKEAKFTFELNTSGEPEYRGKGMIEEASEQFECPRCSKILFEDADKAVKFLKRGKWI